MARRLISIHALREESDPIFDENYRAKLFQSTLSVRRATRHAIEFFWHFDISIHALREESDQTRY